MVVDVAVDVAQRSGKLRVDEAVVAAERPGQMRRRLRADDLRRAQPVGRRQTRRRAGLSGRRRRAASRVPERVGPRRSRCGRRQPPHADGTFIREVETKLNLRRADRFGPLGAVPGRARQRSRTRTAAGTTAPRSVSSGCAGIGDEARCERNADVHQFLTRGADARHAASATWTSRRVAGQSVEIPEARQEQRRCAERNVRRSIRGHSKLPRRLLRGPFSCALAHAGKEPIEVPAEDLSDDCRLDAQLVESRLLRAVDHALPAPREERRVGPEDEPIRTDDGQRAPERRRRASVPGTYLTQLFELDVSKWMFGHASAAISASRKKPAPKCGTMTGTFGKRAAVDRKRQRIAAPQIERARQAELDAPASMDKIAAVREDGARRAPRRSRTRFTTRSSSSR